MRVLVCGDREWRDRGAIAGRLARLPAGAEVVHGAARGADRIAGEEALRLGLAVVAVPAEWDKFGKAAGPIRNRRMLDLKPELVIAFHGNLAESRGTRDTVMEARRRGIPVDVVPGSQERRGGLLPL